MIVGSLLLIVVAVGLLVVGLLQGSDALLVASIGASLLAAVALIVGGRQAAAARSARGSGRTGRSVPSDERYDPLDSRIGHDDLNLSGEHSADDLGGGRHGDRQAVGAGARSGATTYGGSGSGGAGGRYGTGSRLDAGPPAADETAMMAPVRDEPAVIPQQGDAEHGRAPFEEYPAAAGGYDADDDDEPEDEPPIQQSSAVDAARVAAMDNEVLVIDGRPRYHVRGCMHLLGRDSEPLPVSEAVELGFTPCGSCAPNDVILAGR